MCQMWALPRVDVSSELGSSKDLDIKVIGKAVQCPLARSSRPTFSSVYFDSFGTIQEV